MKKVLLLGIGFFLLFSCQQEIKVEKKCPEVNERLIVNVDSLKNEVLEYDSLSIDGNHSLKFSKKEVIGKFGSQYKLIQNLRRNEIIIDFGYIKFMEIDGSYYCTEINLYESDLVVHHPKIKLDKRTLINDVMYLFPNSFKMSESTGSTFWGVIFVNVSEKGLDFRKWVLYFGNGRLSKMMLVLPDNRGFH
jgi:hypothetical protein